MSAAAYEFPTLRLRFACSEPLKYGANAAAQFDDPSWPRFVRITDITEDGRLKEDTFRSLPLEEAAPYLLNDGDVLLARSGSIGRSFIYKPEWGVACHAGYLIRARLSHQFDPKFVYWALNSDSYWAWIEGISIRSTIQNVSAEKYADYALPAPPLETQHRIAQFLDEKTARIDGLIEKKRALLERLAEKRQALITRAVTKGLNPDAPMKPSGIDWLGDIPTHWEVKQLRRVRGYMTSGSRGWAAYYADEGELFLRMTNVTGEGIELDLSELRYVDLEGVTEGTRTSVREGDVLITITAELGAVGIVRKEVEGAYINQHLALFRPRPDLCNSDFLVNFLSTEMARAQFILSGQGGTKQGLGFEQVNNVIIGFPPLDEQRMISDYCSGVWEDSETIELPLRLSIGRLSEYRSALITAAVTGQLELV